MLHNNDTKVLREFDHKNNTHDSIVSNSVAMALRFLYKQLNINLDEAFPKVEAELKSYKDKTLGYEKFKPNTGIDFILQACEEPIVPEFDIVTLFIPTANDPNHQEKMVIPPKWVVVLIWEALKQNHAFEDNTQNGYLERISQFFRTLNELNAKKLCHTGTRHELVFLLNKSYAGIDIIEDARASILAIIRARSLALLAESYKKPESKKKLMVSLLIWFKTDNAEKTLDLLDPNKTIEEEYNQLLIKHGSNPAFKTNQYRLYDQAVSTLSFDCHPIDYPDLHALNKIFHFIPTKDMGCSNAIMSMHHWIETSYDSSNRTHIQAVVTFSRVVETYHKCMAQRFALTVAGLWIGKFSEFEKLCTGYFSQLIHPSKISETKFDLEIIKDISESLNKNEKDRKHFSGFIENFFYHWFEKNREIEIALQARRPVPKAQMQEIEKREHELYRALLDPNLKAQFEFPDEALHELLSIQQNGVIYLGSYEINRIFLHAITTKPENWTLRFGGKINPHNAELVDGVILIVLDFVKTQFNQRNSQIAHALKMQSYPAELIEQIEYLISCYRAHLCSTNDLPEPVKLKRPHNLLLLPRDVMTFAEWCNVFPHIAEQLDEVVAPIAILLVQRLAQEFIKDKEYSLQKIEAILITLPKTAQARFIKSINSCIAECLANSGFEMFIKKFVPINFRKKIYLPSPLTQTKELTTDPAYAHPLPNSKLSPGIASTIIQAIPVTRIKTLISNHDHRRIVHELLMDAQAQLNWFIETRNIYRDYDYALKFKSIPEENYFEFLLSLDADHLNELYRDGSEYLFFDLECIPFSKRPQLLVYVNYKETPAPISNNVFVDFAKLLYLLPESHWQEYIHHFFSERAHFQNKSEQPPRTSNVLLPYQLNIALAQIDRKYDLTPEEREEEKQLLLRREKEKEETMKLIHAQDMRHHPFTPDNVIELFRSLRDKRIRFIALLGDKLKLLIPTQRVLVRLIKPKENGYIAELEGEDGKYLVQCLGFGYLQSIITDQSLLNEMRDLLQTPNYSQQKALLFSVPVETQTHTNLGASLFPSK